MADLLSPAAVAAVDSNGEDTSSVTALGIQFSMARKALATPLSLRAVAEKLNLSVHTIQAIEADAFDRLPPRLFVRGYVQMYAKLLGLSVDSVLRQFDQMYPEPEELRSVHNDYAAIKMPSSPRRQGRARRWVVAGVVVVVLVCVTSIAYRWMTNGTLEGMTGSVTPMMLAH